MMDNKTSSSTCMSPKLTENAKAEQSTDDDELKSNTEVRKDISDVSPALLDKIKSQIEFYFSDVNMQRDKFLIGQAKLDDGWIPMSVMLQFKMLASLCADVDIILQAIDTCDLMEISENRTKIRRRLDKPLPLYNEEYRKAQLARTIYIKGFPQSVGIQELKDFLKDFGSIENIIMRKYKDENKKLHFKGSIFAQFQCLEKAKNFVELQSVTFRGVELIRIFSEQYSHEKNKDRQAKKNKSDSTKTIINEVNKEDGNKTEIDCTGFPKGTILQITTESNNLMWEDIKQAFANLIQKPVFVDYKNGSTNGWIRFQGENSALLVLEQIKDHTMKIKDSDLKLGLLEEAEEEAYMARVKSEQNNIRKLKAQKYRSRKAFKKGKKRSGSPIHTRVAAKKPTL